jgi:hypothetical protein
MEAEFFISQDIYTKKEAVFFKATFLQRDGVPPVEFEGKAEVAHTKNYAPAFNLFKEKHPEVVVNEQTGKVFLDTKFVAPVAEVVSEVEKEVVVKKHSKKELKEIAEENEEASKVE